MIDKFIGQTLANKYRIDSVLREGELGNTYRGMHTAMDKFVTVKILAPALAVDKNIERRFSAEARAASGLSHPNILGVTDFGKDISGAVYLVYEGAESATLKEEIEIGGKFAAERAVSIARQIASALAAAHSSGTIHGALSSLNVLLPQSASSGETVKVLDFGAAKLADELSFDNETANQSVEYLAPEQFTGDADARTDIYSLGVILYEMLAGEVPFSGAGATEIMLKHAEEPPPPLAAFRQDLPAGIEPVVLQAMAKNPEMRYQSANELIADLDVVLRSFGSQTNVPAAKAATAADSGNNIWKTAFVVLAGISLLAIGLIYATSTKQTDPRTAMQTDANGQPVQPINPASGTDEQSLSNMSMMEAQIVGNSNSTAMPPGTVASDGFGDGYNPWANGGRPPAGAPMPMPGQYQPGQIITIGPNGESQFIPQDGPGGGIILVPVPANTAVNAAVKPGPTPRGGNNANANSATAPVQPKTDDTTAPPTAKPTQAPKTTGTPAKPPAKPAVQPKTGNPPPASTEQRGQSGREQDSLD